MRLCKNIAQITQTTLEAHGDADPHGEHLGRTKELKVRDSKKFNGDRVDNAVENFLWDHMDEYLKAQGALLESQKVNVGTRYLIDTTKTWWRNLCKEAQVDLCNEVQTWEEM